MPKKPKTKPTRSARTIAIMKKFAKQLKKARRKAGFRSAERFAHAISVLPHTYRHYERGEAEPDFETIERICDRLKITPNDLFPDAVKHGANENIVLPTAKAM